MKSFVLLLSLIVAFSAEVSADTPANCTYEEIKGIWIFQMGKGGHDRTIDCSKQFAPVSKTRITLSYPDVASDIYGNKGFWTLIYNQGFEVVIHGRKYFAFSKYEGTLTNATSHCDQTQPSMAWSHDVLGHDWSCIMGHKVEKLPAKRTPVFTNRNGKELYGYDPEYIKSINRAQNLWTAGHYEEYEHMTLDEMVLRAGGPMSRIHGRPPKIPKNEEFNESVNDLPDAFDWRDVNGVNYVSPVRDQGSCGSCYAFSSTGMDEARIRVATNNSMQLILSPQDVVDCARYSQGCDGGFPYLIGGKYAEDYGMVTEKCNPYTGQESHTCKTPTTCERHYYTNYRYVGGYYGGCTEKLMRQELVKNGPMSVSFEVYNDFLHYKGGVYIHTGLNSKFNPFHITNHAVLLVGYGIDEDTMTPHWIVKNSWAPEWGEKGYFRIRRGTDECSIESIAVESSPVF